MVEKISLVPTSRGNRPVEPVTIQKVVLSEKAPRGAKGKGAATAAHKAAKKAAKKPATPAKP